MLVLAYQGLPFDIKNQSQHYVFSRHLTGHPFSSFMLILKENDRFGDTFKIEWAPKWDPKSTKWRQFVNKCMFVAAACGPGRFVSPPAFPETIVITVPFGPSGF